MTLDAYFLHNDEDPWEFLNYYLYPLSSIRNLDVEVFESYPLSPRDSSSVHQLILNVFTKATVVTERVTKVMSADEAEKMSREFEDEEEIIGEPDYEDHKEGLGWREWGYRFYSFLRMAHADLFVHGGDYLEETLNTRIAALARIESGVAIGSGGD
jgi:hypothetical protein